MADQIIRKVIITGLPGSGKSTLLERIVGFLQSTRGMVCREIQENEQRVGFEAVTSLFQRVPIAHIGINSPIKVGRYGVSVEALESVLPPLEDILAGEVLYLDEIGQMQLQSRMFKNLVTRYLQSDNPAIMTMTAVYNELFLDDIRTRPDIAWFELSPENRAVVFRDIYTIVDTWQALP